MSQYEDQLDDEVTYHLLSCIDEKLRAHKVLVPFLRNALSSWTYRVLRVQELDNLVEWRCHWIYKFYFQTPGEANALIDRWDTLSAYLLQLFGSGVAVEIFVGLPKQGNVPIFRKYRLTDDLPTSQGKSQN